ncbi:hypothetical protein W59_19343 [Rhodococcus opacus RKJ300 = JCM 13270]|jgi:hypothetical protein|uniref:Uncharacterized protein n=3 Tax=Rhodococcus TaxID=1827 RepID=A0A2S8J194_RHOOP|nr:hypothetical protein W59_19343 [Rhodococcus opacus RKJ300 = JCM 13270]PQP20840.1 hypothetical protein C5613_27080 [Rhodococcus opacus]
MPGIETAPADDPGHGPRPTPWRPGITNEIGRRPRALPSASPSPGDQSGISSAPGIGAERGSSLLDGAFVEVVEQTG